MKKYLRLTAFLLVAILMISISACAAPETNANNDVNNDAANDVAGDDTAEALGPATYQLYTYYNDENSIATVDYALAAVKELMPEITIEVIAIDSTDPNLTKMKGFIAAEDVPEFYNIKLTYVDALLETGQILDLGPYADEVGFTDAVAPSSTQIGRYKGQLLAFPGLTQGFGFLYYNKAIFREAGIEKAPETFDELLGAVDKINAAGYVPISVFGKDQWIWGMMLDGFAGRYDPECTLKIKSGELKFTDPPYLNAANKLQELALAGAFSPNANLMDYPGAEAEFLGGQSAMTLNGAWAFGQYDAALGEDFGYLFWPAMDAAGIEESKTIWAGGGGGPDGYSVNPKKFETQAELDRAVQFAFYLAQATADFYAVNGNPITTMKSDLRPEEGLSANMEQWVIDSGNVKYNPPLLVSQLPVEAGPDFNR
jgi:raffinose/stachyose/melibiose transport system substrate-binding protein